MVWDYRNADCSFTNKFTVLFIIIFGTFSLPAIARRVVSSLRQRRCQNTSRKGGAGDRGTPIGGGAYWAERAAARPLFGSCGPPLSLARPLFGVM